MNIKLKEILDSINIKNFYIDRGSYSDNCVVYTYISKPTYYADNTVKGYSYTILLNVYVRTDIEVTKNLIIKTMNANGIRGGIAQAPIKEKNELYNTPIQFNAFLRV